MSKKKAQSKKVKRKFHIKKGDRVLVIAGAYKGTEGEVLRMVPDKNKAVVEEVNIVTKHVKPSNENSSGFSKEPAPIHLSNLMLIEPSTGEATRIGRRLEGEGEEKKLVRYSKKTGQTID